MTTQDWTKVGVSASGTRSMHAQMTLDTLGMKVLTPFFETFFSATVLPANTKVQLRGVDLCVSVKGRSRRLGSVGIDAKVDGGTTGNAAIELISQDRENSRRAEATEGYIAKDMPLVAYYFPKEGKLLMIDMRTFYPWVHQYRQDLLTGRTSASLTHNSFLTATPNERYLSYSLIAPVAELLNVAPGLVFLDLATLMGRERHEELTGVPLESGRLATVPETEDGLAVLNQWLQEAGCYDIKEPLSADDKERLIRALERLARFKRDPAVQAKGRQLQVLRARRPLPEDHCSTAEHESPALEECC